MVRFADVLKIGLFIFLIWILATRYSQTHRPSPSSSDPIQTPASTQNAPLSAPTRAVTKTIANSTIIPEPTLPAGEDKPPEPPYSKKPDGNSVEFKVVNGYAIAHGDIMLGKVQDNFQGTIGRYDAPTPRTWDGPIIPYLISPDLPNPERVEKALDCYRQNTPVQFIPFKNQKDGIVFQPGDQNCYSYVGKIGGLQPIHLSPNCQSPQVVHEVMHALGFVHEQSRPDRNQYVQIIWNNIDPKFQSEFAMVPDSFFELERTTPFDYHSIMLYPPQMFAAQPGQLTMKSLTSAPLSPTQDCLSEEDIRKVRQLFRQ